MPKSSSSTAAPSGMKRKAAEAAAAENAAASAAKSSKRASVEGPPTAAPSTPPAAAQDGQPRTPGRLGTPARSTIALGDLYSKSMQMVNENKITTKNAFEVPLIESMDQIIGMFMGDRKKLSSRQSVVGKQARPSMAAPSSPASPQSPRSPKVEKGEEEHRFHEASCTIEASARIYACRVDCTHTDAYRVLGGLNTADLGSEEVDGEGGKTTRKRRIVGVNTLERNEANITQQHIDMDEQNDPTFRRMAESFDAGGAKGLLLSHLPVAEDLSLIFNGDVPITRAKETAAKLFAQPDRPKMLRVDQLGLGDPVEARQRLTSEVLPELDSFRRQLWGNVKMDVELPDCIKALFDDEPVAGGGAAELLQDGPADSGFVEDAPDADAFGGDDGPDDGVDMPPPADATGGDGMMPIQDQGAARGSTMSGLGGRESGVLPLVDAEAPVVGAELRGVQDADAIAFDELFEKFVGAGNNQFAYFDECWSKLSAKEKDGKGVLQNSDSSTGPASLVKDSGEGAEASKEKPSKKALFDLSNLEDKPAKALQFEPSHRHQLSDRAAQWQLRKDVPPYMIDRITMPTWPTWSKFDFASLGLRPHLMLKLVRKNPPGDGPHSFSDLFSSVIVENPDAFPWHSKSASAHTGMAAEDEDMYAKAEYVGEDDGEQDFDAHGLPAHLDVNPDELFLGPDDKVVPDCEQEDFSGGFDEDAGFGDNLDFDLADRPATVGSTDIGYSRNSKFVDVKLVKKILLDLIQEDIANAKRTEMKEVIMGFQELVQRLVARMPKSEIDNLSVQVCFICALHLCNEYGLELQTPEDDLLGDFTVWGSAA